MRKRLANELLGTLVGATLMCDNQNSIHLSNNQAHHEMTKHIDVRHHFIREIIDRKKVKLIKVVGDENDADMFTKVAPLAKLKHCMELLQVAQDDGSKEQVRY